MTVAALLVLGMAGADLVGWSVVRLSRGTRRLPTAVLLAIAVWAVVVGAAGPLLFGTSPVSGVAVAAVALAWPLLTSRWVGSALGFVALVAVAAVFEQPVSTGGLFAVVGVDPVLASRLLTVAAVAAFLGLSANIVCRGALERARVAEARALVSERGVPVAEPPSGERRGLPAALRARFVYVPPRPGEMRGGRLIGPLERWLIVALALLGAQGVVAALMAAKGIVRFPEISKNSGEGSKAEEFLIGSMISWGFAGAGAVLLWISA